MKGKYFSVGEIKMRAKSSLRGNIPVMLYAIALPAVIASVMKYIIMKVAPGVESAIDLVVQGKFSNLEEQRIYLLNAMTLEMFITVIVGVLISFLTVGQKMTAIKARKIKNPGYKILFSFFPHWFSALIASVISVALPWAISAGATMLAASKMTAALSGQISLTDYSIASAAMLCAGLVSILLTLKFYFVFYIMAEDENPDPIRAAKESWKMTGIKTCANIILLELSFIGWYILAFFTMGITLLYSLPYAELAEAELYCRIRRQSAENTGVAA